MSIAPSTDIVLEVSRAADPARAAAVAQKLQSLANQGAGSPQDFAAALNAAAPVPSSASTPAADTSGRLAGAAFSRSARAADLPKKLESVVLTELIGEMLPKDTPSAYGQGYAGDMWRSMLAERIADQMAASGRLGIAQRLFANHPLSASASLMGPEKLHALDAAKATLTSANVLSAPSGAKVDNGAVLFAGRRPA